MLTETAAAKYFGSKTPLGETLMINDRDVYTVTGVVQDLPANTHFHFDFLAFNGRGYPDGWTEKKVWTYIKAPENSSVHIDKALSDIIATHYPANYRQGVSFSLQPLKNIHLDSHLDSNIERGGSRTYVRLFFGLAFVFLLIGCINYINLETARSAGRAREVGVHKAIGATQLQVKTRILTEAFCASAIAVGVSFVLFFVLRAPVYAYVGIHIPLPDMYGLFFWFALFASIKLVALVAGGYPALYLSRFSTIKALKGRSRLGRGQEVVRETLVIIQFVATLVLIVGSLVVHKQVDFMLDQAEGIERENTIMIRVPTHLARSWDWDASILTDGLKRLPAVTKVSAIEVPWSRGIEQFYVQNTTDSGPTRVLTNVLWIGDEHYADMYGFSLIEGRTRLTPFNSDSTKQTVREVVINQAAARQLELREPIGTTLSISMESNTWETARVVGLVKDISYQTLHQEIQPLVFINDGIGFSDIAIRTMPGTANNTVEQVAMLWKEIAPAWPLDYFFLDDDYRAQYIQEERIGLLSRVFAFVAVSIACFGLWGLISYIAEHRTKEIGIRKVLGASSIDIAWLVSRNFAKLIVIASILALPISLIVLNRWLDHFASHVPIRVETVIIPIGILAIMVLLTAGYRVLRIATTKAVHTLKYE